MKFSSSILFLLVSNFVALVVSQASYCDGGGKFCLRVTMPLSTARNEDGLIWFTVTGAAAKGWTAFGIGNKMTGSLMFLIYPGDDANNITVSPRISRGQIEPEYYPQTDVYLLQGSGINEDGQMTAMFTCQNCKRWAGGFLDVGNPNQEFIWAVNPKQDIRSGTQQAKLLQHDSESYGIFPLDMTVAVQDDPNPPPPIPLNPKNSGSLNQIPDSVMKKRKNLIIAHAILMGFAFVLFFPLGGIIVRMLRHTIRQSVYLHATLQLLNFGLSIAGLATGIMASNVLKTGFKYSHQFIGVVVMGLIFCQVILGASHHILFKVHRKRTFVSYAHIWLGRTAIIMGIVNGGLGLPLAGASTPAIAIYSGGAAIVFLIYVIGYGGIKIFEHKMGIGKPADDETRKKTMAQARHAADGFDGFEMQSPLEDIDNREYEPVIYNIPGVFTIPAAPEGPTYPEEVYIDPYYKGEYPPQSFSPPALFSLAQYGETPEMLQQPFSLDDSSQHDLHYYDRKI